MVRNYKRKTSFGKTPQVIYDKAVQEIIDGKMSLHGAAKNYNINVISDDITTLQKKKQILVCNCSLLFFFIYIFI